MTLSAAIQILLVIFSVLVAYISLRLLGVTAVALLAALVAGLLLAASFVNSCRAFSRCAMPKKNF
jgi:hypothetical protein